MFFIAEGIVSVFESPMNTSKIAGFIERLIGVNTSHILFSINPSVAKEKWPPEPHYDEEILHGSLLHSTGWWNSEKAQVAVSRDYTFLPTYSYSCIYFLNDKLHPHLSVLDCVFGSSTLYYLSKGIRHIAATSVGEPRFPDSLPDPKYEKLHVHVIESAKALPATIQGIKERFHIVAVGDIAPLACVKEGIKALRKDGVLILNNSASQQAKACITYLHKEGFKHIHFHGLRPLGYDLFCTSIFYRDNNCLDI